MFWKFLFVGIVPALCGIALTCILCVQFWQQMAGTPTKTDFAPKLTQAQGPLTDTVNKFRHAHDEANGALLAYAATKDPKQRELLAKSLNELDVQNKQFKTQARDLFNLLHKDTFNDLDGLPSQAMASAEKLSKAIEQDASADEKIKLSTAAGADMLWLSRAQVLKHSHYTVSTMFGLFYLCADKVLLGIVAFFILTALSAGWLAWSYNNRIKKVEENLKLLIQGKALNAQLSRGFDSLDKIDLVVHEAATQLSSKRIS